MRTRANGFSLIELMIALAITLVIGAIVFKLFQQNERVFRDENLIVEMQQGARAVVSQIADEVRRAGEGVPIYASGFDNASSEPVASILASSSSSRIDFRAGLSDTETIVITAAPIDLTLGTSRTVAVSTASIFSIQLGTASPSGRFVYIWGPTNNFMWAWVRAELTNIGSGTLTLIPRQAGDAGRTGGADVIRFTQQPTVSLEEAVSLYLSGAAVKRATASDMTNEINPSWSAANEIGRNFTSLNFTYYDKNDNVVSPNSLASRIRIARVDVRAVAQTSSALSKGERATYSLSLRTIPRNMQIR